jgi:hypothetical protein
MKYSICNAAVIVTFSALILGGCAQNGNPLTTASLSEPKVAKVAFNPTCVSLTAKIDGLRNEGTMSRLAKISQGKRAVIRVKRTALAKAAELDQANAEFQAKCSTVKPAMSAAAHSGAAKPVQGAVTGAATSTAKQKATSTVTAAATKTAVKAVQ